MLCFGAKACRLTSLTSKCNLVRICSRNLTQFVARRLPTLDEALLDFRTVFELFFDNEFLEALAIVNKFERKSIYHTFGKAVLCFINALVSNDAYEFELAEDAIMDTLKLCINSRRRTSVFDVLAQVLK